MRLIWNQIIKDLLLNKWLLLMWVLLNAITWWLYLDPIERLLDVTPMNSDGISFLLMMMMSILPMIFIPKIVLDDAPMDLDANYHTKPLRSGKLLLAKLIFIAVLFVLIPLFFDWATYIGQGYFRAVWPATLAAFMMTLPMLVLYLSLAMLVSTLSRYIVLVCLIIISGILLDLLLTLVGLNFLKRDVAVAVAKTGQLWKNPSANLMGALSVGLFSGLAACALYQYRRYWFSVLIVAFAGLGFWICFHFWQLPILGPKIKVTQSEGSIEVSLHDDLIGRQELPGRRNEGKDTAMIFASIRKVGQVGSLEPQAALLNSELEIDGEVFKPNFRIKGYRNVSNSSWDEKMTLAAINGQPVSTIQNLELRFPVIDLTDEELEEARKVRHLRSTGKIALLNFEYVLQNKIPLLEGHTVNVDGSQTRLLAMESKPASLVIELGESLTMLRFDSRGIDWRGDPYEKQPIINYALYNEHKQQLIFPESQKQLKRQRSFGYDLRHKRLEWKQELELDESWLADAELVIIEKQLVSIEEGDFSLDIDPEQLANAIEVSVVAEIGTK